MAIEHAYRTREKHPYIRVYWVSATSMSAFKKDYIALARVLDVHRNASDHHVMEEVSRQLAASSKEWLLIIDNADNSTLLVGDGDASCIATDNSPRGECPIQTYLPLTGNGAVLITTRNETLAFGLTGNKPGRVLRVNVFTEKEAKMFVEVKLPPDRMSPADANELAQSLDYIPLAIAHSTAYLLRMPHISASQYMAWMQQEDARSKILSKGIDNHWEASSFTAVLKTLQISIQAIQECNPVAADMLATMSVLDRQSIPAYLWTGPSDFWREDHVQMVGKDRYPDMDRLEFQETVGVLLGFSLLMQQQEQPLFEMHRLVQQAARTYLANNGRLKDSQEHALGLLAAKYPQTGVYLGDRVMSAMLDSHARGILSLGWVSEVVPRPFKIMWLGRRQNVYDTFEVPKTAALLKWRLGLYYMRDRRLDEAEHLMREAIKSLTLLVEVNNTLVLTMKTHLAQVLHLRRAYNLRLGFVYELDLTEALAEARSAVEARWTRNEPCDPNTLESVAQWAIILYHHEQGGLDNLTHLMESCPISSKHAPLKSVTAHLGVLAYLVESHFHNENNVELIHAFKVAKHIRKECPSQAHKTWPVIHTLRYEAAWLRRKGRLEDGEIAIRMCYLLATEVLGAGSQETLGIFSELTEILRQLKHSEELNELTSQFLVANSQLSPSDIKQKLTEKMDYARDMLRNRWEPALVCQLLLSSLPNAQMLYEHDPWNLLDYRWLLAWAVWETERRSEALVEFENIAKDFAAIETSDENFVEALNATMALIRILVCFEQAVSRHDNFRAFQLALQAQKLGPILEQSGFDGGQNIKLRLQLLLTAPMWSRYPRSKAHELLREALRLSGDGCSDDASDMLYWYRRSRRKAHQTVHEGLAEALRTAFPVLAVVKVWLSMSFPLGALFMMLGIRGVATLGRTLSRHIMYCAIAFCMWWLPSAAWRLLLQPTAKQASFGLKWTINLGIRSAYLLGAGREIVPVFYWGEEGDSKGDIGS